MSRIQGWLAITGAKSVLSLFTGTLLANIDPFYFALWASRRRMGFAKTGYYHQQPFHTPPKLGDIYAERAEIITDEDYGVADAIDSCWVAIGKTHPRLAISLEIWEGAYPDAPSSRGARCEDRGVGFQACKKAAARCKKRMERMMYSN